MVKILINIVLLLSLGATALAQPTPSVTPTPDNYVCRVILDYSTYLGGTGTIDYGRGISVGTDGKAYVTGETDSNNFPVVNAVQGTYRGLGDVFVTAFSSTGSVLLYSTYLGGTNVDTGYGISVGTDGRAYVTGTIRSSDFPWQILTSQAAREVMTLS